MYAQATSIIESSDDFTTKVLSWMLPRHVHLELHSLASMLCLLIMLGAQVAAGGALFHLVVDTDEQASDLLRLLKQERQQGRVTCLPLNKLQVDSVQYPDRFGTDALPLTKYLKYSEEVKRAVEQASKPDYHSHPPGPSLTLPNCAHAIGRPVLLCLAAV